MLMKQPNTMRRTITFVVTERCNFRCRYCYVVHTPRRMSLEVAKAGVDMVLAQPLEGPNGKRYDGIVWDFIGGEPLLEADLIGEILDYIHERQRGHYYENKHVAGINTNGANYDSLPVQRLLTSHRCIYVGVTIDGDKVMHDLNRVYPDGRGTYEDVVRNIQLWMKQVPKQDRSPISTKVTINHENLTFFRNGILHLLFDLKLAVVHANTIFEPVWEPGDDQVFEEELVSLGREIRARGLDPFEVCSLFTHFIGRPVPDRKQNWCGVGRYMLAIDPDGDLYPCNHFLPSALRIHKAAPIGTVWSGVDPAQLAPYLAMDRESKSPKECLECQIATGCAWCAGVDFDVFGTLDKRATYICNMHKARVRAVRRLEAEVK